MDERPELRARIDASRAKGLIIGDDATMVVTFHSHGQRTTDDYLADLADQMAISARRQWAQEATWQQLNDPYAIPVRWTAADPALVTHWPTLLKLATEGPGWPMQSTRSWAHGPEELAGTANELVDVLDRIPTGRLVLLGEPGAGKTILLIRLVLDLLSRRHSGEPVPVLLPVASWDPGNDGLYDWMENRLTTDNPALAAPWRHDREISKIRILLETGLILPALDGLDEMPEQLRGAAIAKINAAMRPGQRLILAARLEAYRATVRSPDAIEVKLAGAAGIELCPLDAGVVADYVRESAGGLESAARWDAVIATLTSNSRSSVAQAMTTPLMAALARAMYNPRPGESLSPVIRHPGELLDERLLPTREAVERHLFDGFISSAYRPHPDRSRDSRWTEDQAARWLTFLARDLEYRQGGTTDLAWWQLADAMPKPLAGLIVALMVATTGAFTIPYRGGGIGVLTALLVGLIVNKIVHHDKQSLARGFAGGIIGGQLAGALALATLGLGPGNSYLSSFLAGGITVGIAVAPIGTFYAGLCGAFAGEIATSFYERAHFFDTIRIQIGSPAAFLLNGVGFGLAAGVAAGVFSRDVPARGLKWSKLGFVIGVMVGIMFGSAVWITAGRTVGLACASVATLSGGLAGGLYGAVTPTDLTQATSPSAVLARDRLTFLASLALALSLALTIGLGISLSPRDPFNGQYYGVEFGVKLGIGAFVAIGLGLAFYEALWGRFMLLCLWLSLSRRVPLRLMAFLKDAHLNRGVLRQSGAVYQFRHAELQRRLASRRAFERNQEILDPPLISSGDSAKTIPSDTNDDDGGSPR